MNRTLPGLRPNRIFPMRLSPREAGVAVVSRERADTRLGKRFTFFLEAWGDKNRSTGGVRSPWSTQTTTDLNHGCFSGTVEKDEVVCWKDSTEMHCVGQDIPGKPRRASDTLCFFIASSSPVRPLGPATPSPAPDIPCFGLQPKAIGMFF